MRYILKPKANLLTDLTHRASTFKEVFRTDKINFSLITHYQQQNLHLL